MELQRRQPTYKKIRQVLQSILAEGRAPKLDDLRARLDDDRLRVVAQKVEGRLGTLDREQSLSLCSHRWARAAVQRRLAAPQRRFAARDGTRQANR